MELPRDQFSTHRQTLFALYAGALLTLFALISELAHPTPTSASVTANHTTIALGVLTLFLFVMAHLYENGHQYVINVAVIVTAFFTPFVFDSLDFLHSSLPHGVWLPFIFALIVSQFNIAIIALIISLGSTFFTYPNLLQSSGAITEVIIIFLLLMLSKLILQRLKNAVIKAPSQQNALMKKITDNEDMTDQKITESDLNALLEESGDAIWICNTHGDFVYANPAAFTLTGYDSKDLIDLRLLDIIHETHEDELAEYFTLAKHSKFTRREMVLNHKNGSTIYVEITTEHLSGDRIIVLGRDLTEKMNTETERYKLFQAVEQNPGCIIITNLNGEIDYVNGAFLMKTGYTRNEVIGENPRIIKSEKTPSHTFIELWKTIKQGETWQGEITNLTKSGQEFIQFTTISPIRQSDGEISNYIAISEDITIRKRSEERIIELACFDQLTGLPNRTLLLDRLTLVVATSARSGVFGALLFIDLDNFKNINDTLGHQKGDLVIKQAAECLLLRTRESDTISRFGGDEFVVLLTDLGSDAGVAANKARITALKLLGILNQTYQLGEVAYHSTASIGVTMFNGKFCTTDELLKQADLAMYKSKKAGKNTIRFFDPSLESAMKQRASMEKDLRIAIQNKQFVLHYQGQFTHESKLIGAEVLLRWEHPEQGMLSPALFIPSAEETGLILPIGNWVLETACAQLAEWAKIPDRRELILAVNVSALQFRQTDFVKTILSIIQRSGANPHRLKIELTESMLVENVDDIIQKMLALKKHGIEFSLDDFGTGYSSLSFLKRLPLNQIKIDQSFIRDVHNDPNGAAIAKTIVSLGKSLGLNVIAEGIETIEQREFLINAGCFAFQGYLFACPLTIHDFEKLVTDTFNNS